MGIASLVLGGGREKKEDVIDPAVGSSCTRKSAIQFAKANRSARFTTTLTPGSMTRVSLLQQAYRVA